MTVRIDLQIATLLKNHPTTQITKKWVTAALNHIHHSGELNIRVVDEAEMKQLNQQYRNKPKPTNVLSFPCQLPAGIRGDLLGDIVICAPVIEQEAKEQQKSLQAHWAHMIIHGVLHLCGFDHEDDHEAQIMENVEKAVLHELGFPDPYTVEKIYD